jgi:hypothetical protein
VSHFLKTNFGHTYPVVMPTIVISLSYFDYCILFFVENAASTAKGESISHNSETITSGAAQDRPLQTNNEPYGMSRTDQDLSTKVIKTSNIQSVDT